MQLQLCVKFTHDFNRNTTEDVWIGLIKHQDSHVWYDVRKDKLCERNDVYYPGQLYHERQCAVLNMSGSVFAGNSHIIYAENCEGRQLGFVCLSNHGQVPTCKSWSSPDSYTRLLRFCSLWILTSTFLSDTILIEHC